MAPASEQNQASPAAASGSQSSDPSVDWSEQVEFLRGLAAIVRDEELSELMIEQGGVRLSLRSRRPSLVPPEPATLPATAMPVGATDAAVAIGEDGPEAQAAPGEEEEPGTPIVSPMVGVLYRSKTPDDPPFVSVGDRVEVGQVIGLVEAMKTFNEIVSEVEGEVIAIPAQNAEEVQAGAPLIIVR